MNYEQIIQMANKYLNHATIREHTRLPSFPGRRAKLLHMFLQNGSSRIRAQQVPLTLATLLMQIALDTHDLVDAAQPQKNKKSDRETQYRVLAGDYFSSRFYQLLSKSGLIEMVHLLSEAIGQTNRLKVNLYVQSNQLLLSSREYVKQVVNIRNELFRVFTHVLEGTSRVIWPELLQFFSTCEVYSEELDDLEQEQVRTQGWVFWYLLESGTAEDQAKLRDQFNQEHAGMLQVLAAKYEVQNVLYDKLSAVYIKLKSTIEKIENDAMRQEILRLCDPFVRRLSDAKV